MFAQIVDRRQSLPDSRVVSDAKFAATCLGRYVEVSSHQHAFSAHIQIAKDELCHFLLVLLLVLVIVLD